MFATLVGGCAAALAATAAERGLRLWGRPARGAWAAALVVTALLPIGAAAFAPAAAQLAREALLLGSARAAALPSGPSDVLELAPVVVRAAGGVALGDLRWLDLPLALLWGGSAALGVAFLWRTGRTLQAAARGWEARVVDGIRVEVTSYFGPAVLGVSPPRIAVPGWALTLERPLRTLVLRHELEHARAGDPALVVAGAALVALMPWNPAAWWIARRLRAAVEIDCDARVLRAHPDVTRYGTLLLAVAQRGVPRAPHALAALAALAPARSDLARRIEAMRARPVRAWARAVRTAGLAAGGAGSLLALLLACGVPDVVAPRAGAGRVDAAVEELNAALREQRAQPPQATSDGAVYFEFQVEDPVRPVDGARGPRYPAEARAAGREGEVLAQFVVDTTGLVEMATFKVLKSTGPEFVAAVREGLMGMRFEPARVGGRPVRQLVQQPFQFALTR
jgi:TonB family protein